VPTCLIEYKNLPDSLAKVQVFVNLTFNVNVETLSLVHINMEHDLSTLTRVLSTTDASNYVHPIGLRMDPIYTCDKRVDWDGWANVYRFLRGLSSSL
jgi:hypothetical protein